MSDGHAAGVRARLLAALNHDLRAPLARIASQAASTGDAGQALHAIESGARRQMEWLSDLHECARFELQPPELTPAPAYLHTLMQQVRYDREALPALALLDARRLAQVLRKLREHAAAQVSLRVGRNADVVALHFSSGDGDAGGEWRAVPASLDQDPIVPGLVLAAHLVRAMGGLLLRCGDSLSFEVRAKLAEERDAMPPAPRFELPEPFGGGHAVLVLEPHGPMQDYLSEVLESAAFDVRYTADGGRPALVLCADESVWDTVRREDAPPVLLHAALPPQRPQDFACVLYKPAPPQALLDAVRRLLEVSRPAGRR